MTRPTASVTAAGAIVASMPVTAYSDVIGDCSTRYLQLEMHNERDAQRMVDDLRALAIQIDIALRRTRAVALAMAGNGQ